MRQQAKQMKNQRPIKVTTKTWTTCKQLWKGCIRKQQRGKQFKQKQQQKRKENARNWANCEQKCGS